jgi:electron transport complex protein RnfC
VKIGDHVERGDKVGEADGFMSVPIHASAAGTVVDAGWWPHPDGTMAQAVRIKVDRFASQVARPRLVPHWEGLTPDQVVKAVQDAGVVGLGGAAFPTHVKLAPPKEFAVHTLIINGAECEPYLTSDHRTMVEYPDRVHFGIRVMMRALGVSRSVIGVEKNKPDAIEALRRTVPPDLDVTILPLTVKYPQGAEKMLIHAVTGVEVPSGHCRSASASWCRMSARVRLASFQGRPSVDRADRDGVGHGLHAPRTSSFRGTKLRDCSRTARHDGCGRGHHQRPDDGRARANLDAPVIRDDRRRRAESARHERRVFRAFTADDVSTPVPCSSILRCSATTLVCSAILAEAHLADCMLCAARALTCPSNIPLSQLFQASKIALRRAKAVVA